MLSSESSTFVKLLAFLLDYVEQYHLSESEIDSLCRVMGYNSEIVSLLKSLFAD